jgi:CheY-like chemotaxis protein
MRSILIVDDDDEIRQVLTDFLVDEGYEVLGASNGAAALGALEHAVPSAILLDLTMPVMDGPSFRKKQLADAKLADVPLLVMSADDHLAVVTKELKAWAHLPKPVHLEFLRELLQAICGAARTEQPPERGSDQVRAGRGHRTTNASR